MKTPRSAGLVSHMWMKLVPGGIQQRVDAISRRFTGSGWKQLPQELVDEILGYLLDDLNALKACSRTCKSLFGATRPLIHQRLCLVSRSALLGYPKESRSSLRKRGPEAFKPLIVADRSGLLRYTRYLTFKMGDGSFNPKNMEKYRPHLRSITNLHSLTLMPFRVHQFIPVFNECFGMLTGTIRHLDIRNACTTGLQLLYIISQFPLLEDLTVVFPREDPAHLGHQHPIPAFTKSPPLRGTLALVQVYSRELFEGLGALPGGLNSCSLELFRCEESQIVLDVCSHSVTSISYMWHTWNNNSTPLDLGRSVMLKRFEFTVSLFSISRIHEWIHHTLRTITSPLFNELVIWILDETDGRTPLSAMNADSWKAVDALLGVLAGRNPDFGVTFRDGSNGNFSGDFNTARRHIESCLPLSSLKGFVRFELVPNVENRFKKMGVL